MIWGFKNCRRYRVHRMICTFLPPLPDSFYSLPLPPVLPCFLPGWLGWLTACQMTDQLVGPNSLQSSQASVQEEVDAQTAASQPQLSQEKWTSRHLPEGTMSDLCLREFWWHCSKENQVCVSKYRRVGTKWWASKVRSTLSWMRSWYAQEIAV